MTRPAVAVLTLLALAATARGPRAFRFDPDAQNELRRLWAASSGAKAERVACLAGEIRRDTVHVTRVLPLTGWADSLNVSARQSLEECVPPRWQGTVHTHVALYDGQRPYARFSGADRGVNRLWWRRWNTDGMFCVLYSPAEAYCEIDGPRGVSIYPRSSY
ncbi:MAG TPA: hypothetical protein VHG35_16390 [Gemmatimonadales bacterium]|nr:hypothetical protein [Gemmatimonadales bacterium]